MSDQLNLFDQRRAESTAEEARERSIRRLTAKGEAPENIAERHSISVRDVKRVLGQEPEEQTIEQRWDAFAGRNPHVLEAALQIARAWLERGDKYISAKAVMENLRVKNIKGGEVHGDGGYKLNNDFTAPLGRWLVQHEPKLDGVIRFRERKAR